jgi:hypothetical protein
LVGWARSRKVQNPQIAGSIPDVKYSTDEKGGLERPP